MKIFNKRGEAFENKFAHDNEMQFKAKAQRNKLLGLWAAELLGKTGQEAIAYADNIVRTDCKKTGDYDIFTKITNDLSDKTEMITIRKKMNDLLLDVQAQLIAEI